MISHLAGTVTAVAPEGAVIEVPTLRIAGYTVGPVWFAKRSNAAYDDMMSYMTDQPILAAIGGSALKDFRITMDYPHQRATFEKPAARKQVRTCNRPFEFRSPP